MLAVNAKVDPDNSRYRIFVSFKPNKTVIHRDEDVVIQVENQATYDEYVNILDIQAGGEVEPIWPKSSPDEAISWDNTKVPPGKDWVTLWNNTGKPNNESDYTVFHLHDIQPGEFVEAIAVDASGPTSQHVDFSSLATEERGAEGADTPLNALLRSAVTGERDMDPPAVTTSDWGAALMPVLVTK
jgi:hypothetical protein